MAQSKLTYPIKCNSEQDLLAIHKQIYEWLDNDINVHFIYNAHTLNKCSVEFTDALYGHNPQRKIILISHDENMEKEVAALATVFVIDSIPNYHGVAVGDRLCSYCKSE